MIGMACGCDKKVCLLCSAYYKEGCLAGHRDDDFYPASDNTLAEKLADYIGRDDCREQRKLIMDELYNRNISKEKFKDICKAPYKVIEDTGKSAGDSIWNVPSAVAIAKACRRLSYDNSIGECRSHFKVLDADDKEIYYV
jgi:hypothetical protein